jgi:hypothetical protein
MSAKNIRELTEDEMMIFLVLEQNPNVEPLFKEFLKTNGGWVLEAISKRFSVHQINADKRIMIAILSIGNGVIGKCAKYVDDIAQWCSDNKCVDLEWRKFTMQVYPHGIPVF